MSAVREFLIAAAQLILVGLVCIAVAAGVLAALNTSATGPVVTCRCKCACPAQLEGSK